MTDIKNYDPFYSDDDLPGNYLPKEHPFSDRLTDFWVLMTYVIKHDVPDMRVLGWYDALDDEKLIDGIGVMFNGSDMYLSGNGYHVVFEYVEDIISEATKAEYALGYEIDNELISRAEFEYRMSLIEHEEDWLGDHFTPILIDPNVEGLAGIRVGYSIDEDIAYMHAWADFFEWIDRQTPLLKAVFQDANQGNAR